MNVWLRSLKPVQKSAIQAVARGFLAWSISPSAMADLKGVKKIYFQMPGQKVEKGCWIVAEEGCWVVVDR